MKRQTIVSALALVGTLVFAGCGGGGAGSASANGCGGGGYGGSGTVYPANVAYSVPFSSQTVSGTLQFPADQSCHQVSASASTALPSGASAVPVGAGESVLTIVTAHIAGDWNTQVPTCCWLSERAHIRRQSDRRTTFVLAQQNGERLLVPWSLRGPRSAGDVKNAA